MKKTELKKRSKKSTGGAFLNQISIKWKLLAVVLPLVICIILSVAVLSNRIYSTADDVTGLYYDRLYQVNNKILTAEGQFYQAHIDATKMFLDSKDMDGEKYNKLLAEYKDLSEKAITNVHEAVDLAAADASLYTGTTPDDREDTFEALNKGFENFYRSWSTAYDFEARKGDFTRMDHNFTIACGNLSTMKDIVVKWTDAQSDVIQARTKATVRGAAVLFIVLSVILVLLSTVIAVSIERGIMDMTGHLKVLSQNDLTKTFPDTGRRDEIGQMEHAFAVMQKNLIHVVSALRHASDELTGSCDVMDVSTREAGESMQNIRSAAEDLASTSSMQASQVESVLTSVGSLTQIMEQSKEAALRLSEASGLIDTVTGEGVSRVEELTGANQKSMEAFSLIFDAIDKIQKSAGRISEASGLIASIATQTNLLSLNASIEAARAGEAGRGFSVVAQEIRNLSDQSAQSVATINELLEELKEGTDHAAKESNHIKTLIERQNESVQETKGSFDKIVDSIGSVDVCIEEMNQVNSQLTTGFQTISGLVDSLSAASEENAATAQELAATSEQVSANVEHLHDTQQSVSNSVGELGELINEFAV